MSVLISGLGVVKFPCVGVRESTYRNCSPEATSQGLVYSLTCASLTIEVPCRRARSSG